jgi:hypothetical protein
MDLEETAWVGSLDIAFFDKYLFLIIKKLNS